MVDLFLLENISSTLEYFFMLKRIDLTRITMQAII